MVAKASVLRIVPFLSGLNAAYAVVKKVFPSKRKRQKENETAGAVLCRREAVEIVATTLGTLSGEKKDIQAVQLTASNQTELVARLKYVAATHGEDLASEAVAVIVRMQKEAGAT